VALAEATSGDPAILIVAAEASSALYARRLLEHWQRQQRPVKAFGVGSREMEALGFEVLGRSEEMAVVGLIEVLRHYRDIRRVFRNLVKKTGRRRPEVVLLMDYPDFNLRLAQALKPFGIPIVYYISPQVWAWRKSRVRTIRNLVDKMLCVLPFEKEFYRRHGVDVEFVGHPLIDEIDPVLFHPEERERLRSRHSVMPGECVVGLMPGSRQSEIHHHLAIQLRAAEMLHERYPALKFALLVAPSFDPEWMRKLVPQSAVPLLLVQDEPLKMVGLTDLVLCASGTATLVVGLMRKPMVIMYKMNALSALLARLVVKGTAYFGLVNLILERRVVPELFQEEATSQRLAEELARYIDDASLSNRTESELLAVRDRLGSGGATQRVAKILDAYLFRGRVVPQE
jgi:lipid-A-disaccharide synthase